ncbi:response regulator [Bdellovibrionota bacterium FG-2]
MLREDINILVVDDVNSIRIHVKELLRTCGFKKIVTASGGEEAKVLLETQPFQLILCDWHMDPTTGFELLRYTRNHPQFCGIAFILVTAENTRDRVLDAVAAGVDDYIVKPLTQAQIQNKVYSVLLKRKVLT